MSRIYKYPLELRGVQIVRTPKCFKPIHVDMQRGTICVWAEVDLSPTVERQFIICGTGDTVPTRSKYIGTAIDLPNTLVWHVYEGIDLL